MARQLKASFDEEMIKILENDAKKRGVSVSQLIREKVEMSYKYEERFTQLLLALYREVSVSRKITAKMYVDNIPEEVFSREDIENVFDQARDKAEQEARELQKSLGL